MPEVSEGPGSELLFFPTHEEETLAEPKSEGSGAHSAHDEALGRM